jgi:hypothetical protein
MWAWGRADHRRRTREQHVTDDLELAQVLGQLLVDVQEDSTTGLGRPVPRQVG